MLDAADYSREHGYVIVLDISAQGTPVVYSSSEIDISNDIVRLYDQAYPVKAAGASSTSGFAVPVTSGKGAISRSSAFHGAKEARPIKHFAKIVKTSGTNPMETRSFQGMLGECRRIS
jgi:hypothetical protein